MTLNNFKFFINISTKVAPTKQCISNLYLISAFALLLLKLFFVYLLRLHSVKQYLFSTASRIISERFVNKYVRLIYNKMSEIIIQKVFLEIPYEHINFAKDNKLHWASEEKKWTIQENHPCFKHICHNIKE